MHRQLPRLPVRAGHRSHTEGEAAEGRVGFERRTDLLKESIEGGVPRRRIAFLDVDLDLDCVLVVRTAEATRAPARARPGRRPGG